MRLFCAVLVAVSLGIAFEALADDKLPAQLAGTGQTMRGSAKGTAAAWSIAIASQDDEGNLKGTMNWSGHGCQLSRVPFTGTYRNGVLDLQVPATSRNCGEWTITLTQSPGKDLLLEGTARMHGTDKAALVTLRPR